MLILVGWALAMAVAGAAVWFLVDRDIAAGRWLLAALLVGHGLVHAMFLIPQPEPAAAGGASWPFAMSGSWVTSTAGVDASILRAVGVALIAAVAVAGLLAGSATIGFVLPATWWPGFAGLLAIGSALILALFFDSQLLLGLGIDVVLLWVVLGTSWTPLPG